MGEKSWTYQTALPAVSRPEKGTKVALVFEGLDTFATVKVNGKVILETSNQFIPYRAVVNEFLNYGDGSVNLLTIDFASAFQKAREIKDAHPEHKWVGFNGDMSRLAVRKAQYHW